MPKRPCDVFSGADFARYYDGGWIGLTEEGSDIVVPARVRAANGNEVLFVVLTKTPQAVRMSDERITLSWADLQTRATFGCPAIGMLYDDTQLFYGAALAERHSNRGLRLERVHWHEFNRWHLRSAIGPAGPPISNSRFDLVWQVFNPVTFTASEAYRKLLDGESSGLPLSQHLGMYTTGDKAFPILAYKRWSIGYFETEGLLVLGEKYREFQEELRHFLKLEVRI